MGEETRREKEQETEIMLETLAKSEIIKKKDVNRKISLIFPMKFVIITSFQIGKLFFKSELDTLT